MMPMVMHEAAKASRQPGQSAGTAWGKGVSGAMAGCSFKAGILAGRAGSVTPSENEGGRSPPHKFIEDLSRALPWISVQQSQKIKAFEQHRARRENIMQKNVKSGSNAHKSKIEPISDLRPEGVAEISASLRQLLADVFALYLKTKNFHWHMNGPHFRDYHLLLDDHGDQLFAMTDDIAERARKLGGTTLHSISDISAHQRLKDNNHESVAAQRMLAELCHDNQQLTKYLRTTHDLCDEHGDVATASLIENWIDETERRTWFLAKITGQ
jgi:starvation-inducible DNA-binding protein